MYHPITYVSGTFYCFTNKKPNLTQRSICHIPVHNKKMAMYPEDAKLILQSDHNTVGQVMFLHHKMTKVDNCSFKLSDYDIHFECNPGFQNILADCMFHLLHLGLTEKLPTKRWRIRTWKIHLLSKQRSQES